MKFINRKYLFPVILVVIGLSVTGYSYYRMGALKQQTKQFSYIPVPTRDIPAYTTVAKSDIVLKEITKSTEPTWAIKQPEEIVGKVALTTLRFDAPINPNDISNTGNLPNLQIVSVNIDAARTAGAQQGDIVDVYWITAEQNGQANSRTVAANARVVEVCDANGQPTSNQTAIQQSVSTTFKSPSGSTMIYRLLVKPEEVAGVVPGGAPKNTSIALVKKFAESKPPATQAPLNPTVTKGDAKN